MESITGATGKAEAGSPKRMALERFCVAIGFPVSITAFRVDGKWISARVPQECYGG